MRGREIGKVERMGAYTFDIMSNSGIDYSLVLTEYARGEHGIKLGQPFLEPEEVDAVFDELISAIQAARQKALDLKTWHPKQE